MSVHFMFTGDNKDLLKKAQDSRKEILAIDKQAKETSQSMETSFGSMGAAIAAFFTAQQASAIINRIIEVRGEFQKFKAVLSNTLGSDQEAQSAMNMLTDFASKTPFQVNELTASFVKLANQGFTPAYDEMMKLGDLASSTGKGFDQLAEAIIDAQTGEMERLKEFGIRASKDGDKVTFTFKEQQTTVDNSAKAIRGYILSLGAMEGVTGANAKIAATLTGQVSNLEDSITSMYNKIGQQHEGILSDAVGGAATLVENYEEVGAALAALIVSFGAYKAVTMGLVAMERSQANIKYTQEAAELAKLLPIKEAAINADISAAVAKGALTTAQAEEIILLRGESAANLQALQAVAAKAAAEKIAAKAVYESSLARELASKQMTIQRREELAAAIATGNAEQIATAKGALASANTEKHIAVKGRKIAADNLSVASTNAESTAKAVNDVTTKAGTLSDIQATKAKGLLAIAARGLAAAFNMIKGPLIIAAIAGIAYAVYKLITADTAAEKAQKRLNEEREKSIQLKQQMTSEADGLIAKINDETETIYAQIKAYDELIKRFPELKGLSFEGFKVMPQDKQKKMIGGILDEQELKNAEKAYEESLKRVEEIKRQISNAESTTRKTNMVGYAGVAGATEETNVAGGIDKDLEAALILLKGHEEELEKIKELQWKANTPIEEQIKHYEAIQTKLKEEFDALNKLQNPNKELQSYAESVAGYWLDTRDIIGSITLDGLNKQIEDTRDKLKGLRGEEDSKVQNKSYWEKKKKTADDNLGLLPDSKKGSKEWNGYLAEIREAEKALAKYDTTNKAGKNREEEQKKALEARKKLNEELLSLRMQNQQAEINLMAEGREKRLAQIEFDYDSEIAIILAKEKEWKEAQGGKLTEDQTKEIHVSFLNSYVKKEKSTATVDKDQLEAEKQAMNEYLVAYGNYQEKRKAITDLYNEKITKEPTAGGKLSLKKQLEDELKSIDLSEFKDSINFAEVFGNLDNLTADSVSRLRNKLKEYINKAASGLSPEDLKELSDALSNIEIKAAEKNPFGEIGKSLESYKKASEELEKVQETLNYVMAGGEIITGLYEDSTGKLCKKLLTQEQAENILVKAQNKRAETLERLNTSLSAGAEKASEYLDVAIAMTGALEDFGVEVPEQLTGFIDGMGKTLDSLASIDLTKPMSVITGAIGAIGGIGKAIGSLFNNDRGKEKNIERLQDQIETLDKSYELLGDSIEKAYSKDASQLIEQQNKLLEQQKVLIQQQIREEDDKKKTDHGKIKDWQNQLEEIDKTLADNKEKAVDAIFGEDLQSAIDNFAQAYADAWASGEDRAKSMKDVAKKMIQSTIVEMIKSSAGLGETVKKIREMITGYLADGVVSDWEQGQLDAYIESETAKLDGKYDWADKYMKEDKEFDLGITSDSIADTIAEGLADGKSGFKDFAGSFEDMMRTAVINSLKTKHLEGPLKEFQKKFSELSESGGQLTEAEIEELRGMYADIIDGAKVQFDSLKDIAGLDFTADSDNSLKGAYAKASQESITLLAGQTGAQRVIMEDIRNNMIPIREQMQAIREMNSKGWEDVKVIRELTVKIEKNSEQVADNTRMIHEVASKVAENTKRTVETLEGRIDVNIKGM